MKLLTSQKNDLFHFIEEAGLSPAQFEFTEVNSLITPKEIATQLSYKNTEFFFAFETNLNSHERHYSIYAPGESEFKKTEYPGSWRLQVEIFKKWLNNLKREVRTEDKWARLESEIHSFDFKFGKDNDKFSAIEYEELCIKIDLIKSKSKDIGLSEAQLAKLNEGMDFLKEKAKHLGKIEWKSLFVGIIVQYIIQLSLPPATVSSFMNIIKTALKTFLLN